MVTIKFFAMLKNLVGKEEAQISLDQEVTLSELKEILSERFPEISDYLAERRLLISVNHEFADSTITIKDGDEVALLPPFSGG